MEDIPDRYKTVGQPIIIGGYGDRVLFVDTPVAIRVSSALLMEVGER